MNLTQHQSTVAIMGGVIIILFLICAFFLIDLLSKIKAFDPEKLTEVNADVKKLLNKMSIMEEKFEAQTKKLDTLEEENKNIETTLERLNNLIRENKIYVDLLKDRCGWIKPKH